MVDEFPTIMLQGIDTFIGTARKHYVSTILAVQDFNRAIRDYGDKSANILKSSCGTQAYGMTGNDKTARDIESFSVKGKKDRNPFRITRNRVQAVRPSPCSERKSSERET